MRPRCVRRSPVTVRQLSIAYAPPPVKVALVQIIGVHGMGGRGKGGFSMIELMVTIAIVAILVAVAFPSFEGSLRSNRLATAANELNGSFSLARSEALRNPQGATLCTSADGTTCGGTWNDGWLVGVNLDNNCMAATGTFRPVRFVDARERLTFAGTAAGAASPTRVCFDHRGRVRDNAARNVVITPVGCPAGQPLVRTLALKATGQLVMNRTACS